MQIIYIYQQELIQSDLQSIFNYWLLSMKETVATYTCVYSLIVEDTTTNVNFYNKTTISWWEKLSRKKVMLKLPYKPETVA